MIDLDKAKNFLSRARDRAARAIAAETTQLHDPTHHDPVPEEIHERLAAHDLPEVRGALALRPRPGPTSSSAALGPVWVVLTRDELVILRTSTHGSPTIDRAPYEHLYWNVESDGTPEGWCEIQLRMPSDDFSFTTATGKAIDEFTSQASHLVLERAKSLYVQSRFFFAEVLIQQIAEESPHRAEAEAMLEPMGRLAQIAVVYEGGHWEHASEAPGVLRLDALGVEFSPTAPDSPGYFRVSYAEIFEVPRPQPGPSPSELIRSGKVQRSAHMAMTAAAGMAASLVVGPGGLLLGRGLADLLGAKDSSGRPPVNRLVVVAQSRGIKFPLYFNAVSDRLEQIEAEAREFCNRAATVRPRFGRTADSGPGTRDANRAAFELIGLIHELRERGALTDVEFETHKARLLEPAPAKAPTAVVRCPGCHQKLRTRGPGIVNCPECSTSLRIPDQSSRL